MASTTPTKAESRKANSVTEVCLHDLQVGNQKTVMTALKQKQQPQKEQKYYRTYRKGSTME